MNLLMFLALLAVIIIAFWAGRLSKDDQIFKLQCDNVRLAGKVAALKDHMYRTTPHFGDSHVNKNFKELEEIKWD